MIRAASTAAVLATCAVAMAMTGGEGEMRWEDAPEVQHADSSPDERVATGTVSNDTSRAVVLRADRASVMDTAGRELPTSASFADQYTHSLYPSEHRPPGGDALEDVRLGRVMTLEPGQQARITVGWRAIRGAGPAASIRLGKVTLPLPR